MTGRRGLVAAGVAVALLAAAVVVWGRLDVFSGRCLDDVSITSGLADHVDVAAVAVDPLHLSARVPRTVDPTAPNVRAFVRGGLVAPPGTYADITATGPATADGVAVTMALRPLDQVGGFPGTPPMPTMTPGATGTVTVETSRSGKTETISEDSLRPRPTQVPGPSSILYAEPDGRLRTIPIEVTAIVDGRVAYRDPGSGIPPHTPGGGLDVVLPDRRCRGDGIWPPFLTRVHRVIGTGEIQVDP